MFEPSVNAATRGTRCVLEFDCRRLTGVSNLVLAAWLVVLVRAIGSGTRLATQVVFEIYQIPSNLGYSWATHKPKFHTAFVTVFIFHGVKCVRQRACALVQFFFVCTCVVDKSVVAHDVIDFGK